jgi:hypothetical protein
LAQNAEPERIGGQFTNAREPVRAVQTSNHAMNVNLPNDLDANLDQATWTGSRLSRRTLLSAILLTPAAAAVLAACGDRTQVKDASENSSATSATAETDPPTTATTAPPVTTVVPAGIEHPTGADEVVLRLGFVGGFVPTGYAFTSVPSTLITGDGRVIQPGATTAIFPGPLLPAFDVRTISEAAIQTILAAADEANLLAPPPDYSAQINVADAPDTQLELHAAGGAYVHLAMALGFDDPAASPSGSPTGSTVRQTLSDFCNSLGDLDTLVGRENLSESVPLVVEAYRFQARPVSVEELAGYTEEPKPTQIPWPLDLGVSLASAAECAQIDAAKIGNLFSDANQLTFFVEGATTYMVAAVAMLPGDTC